MKTSSGSSSEGPGHDPFKKANNLAYLLLPSHPAGFTPEDMVGVLLLNLCQRGFDENKIIELVNAFPWLNRVLSNTRANLLRRENALKRGGTRYKKSGGREPPEQPRNTVPLEVIEESVSTGDNDDPEQYVIRQQENQLIDEVFARANLSETKEKILKLMEIGYIDDEIAKTLGISKASVQSRKCTALKEVKRVAKELRLRD